jgi:hypothetical protein
MKMPYKLWLFETLSFLYDDFFRWGSSGCFMATFLRVCLGVDNLVDFPDTSVANQ